MDQGRKCNPLKQAKGILMNDKIIQVSGFSVQNTAHTQCDFMLVAVTESGKVLMSTGDGRWASVGPKEEKKQKLKRPPTVNYVGPSPESKKNKCTCGGEMGPCILNPIMGCRNCHKPI